MTHLVGSCACGAVRLTAEADARRIVNCHCSMCRRMNGSAFSSYVVIPHRSLTVIGDEQLGTYQAAPGARKHYCSKCGTPLFNLSSRYAGACMLYLGIIEPQPADVPSLNVYCQDMLDWVERIGTIEKLQTGADDK
jgi:hypothetical protein